MRPSKDSVITIGILLLISLIFSILLYLDLHEKSKQGSNPLIGEITFKQRFVHRKIDSSVVWDDIETKSLVANKDTIRTLDYSDAVLTLKDGTKVRLSDNSMIYIDLSEKNLNIKFDYGSISTSRENGSDPNTKLSINSGDKVIEIDNGSAAKLSKNEDENVNIQVEKGQAKLSLQGKEEILKVNETAELREDKIDVKPIRFLLQTPTDGKYFSTYAETLNAEFKWNPLDRRVSVEFQLAKDKSFRQIINKQTGIKDSGITLALNPGIYFWRISAKNPLGGKQEVSEIRKLTIFAERTVNIITPQDQKVITYTNKIPTIALRWTKNDFSSSYKVDIAHNPDFSNMVKTLDSFENHISTDITAKGIYYIRVTTRPNIPDLSPVVSPVNKFSIEERQIPEPPEIISPVTNASFGIDFIQKGKILFNWRDNREFASYDLEVSRSSDFSSLLIKQNIRNNFSSPELKELPGDLYWRVRGILPDGRKSEYSRVNPFRITEPASLKLIYPDSQAELDMSSDKSITFRWQRPETSGTYLLEVSSSSDFSDPILKDDERIVIGYSKKVSLKFQGKYYWRLKLLSRDNIEITKSEDRSFTILTAPTPKPITPLDGSSIDLTNKQDIYFSWTKDEKAVEYNVEIFDTTSSNKRVLASYNTTGTFYSFTDLSKIREGKFKWSLSIVYSTKDGRLIKSPPTSFQIYLQAPRIVPPIPVALQPLNGTDLVMGEKEEVAFRWEINDKAVYYQVDVQEKSTQRIRPVFQKQTSEASAVFQIPLTVGEGIYYWDLFIFYKGSNGRIIRSNPIRNEFALKFPYRNPPIPILISPSTGENIQPNDSWLIPLIWESNDRAISYNVLVSEAETNKAIFQETTELLRSSLIVSDSVIKPGKYIWSVSINYKAKDGRIIKSPSRKQDFILSMPSFEVPIPIAIAPEPDSLFIPTDQSELEFRWEKSESAVFYNVEIFELREDNQVLIAKKDTNENSYIFKDMSRLTNGRYLWKLAVAYKDRRLNVIKTEPLLTEFTVQIPIEDAVEPPQILTKPRLYVE